ncbi:CBS domain-containing protein [Streptococcus dysgalactiae]|uniref:5'-AMP-activated protein kinase subunit gamma-3 n=2 Tax=Streptococcus dysgalactiae TaxID=1334 RepID=A0A9X9SIJ8_STRDY|nr:CBS domain-containing protein [Streptococcus dysgalactiae]MCL6221750.1 CBS domain-containing protein [Streptococcus dysgalactiae subsp. equisimilis]MDY4034143.1 CBS domain-containing protein [Streptococcus dysgalactiae]MEC4577927.1 CBS domain-containing protein [Streptococcus dysgalactiae]QGH03594.1 CBS domain-containing protein [Streptococcus dysgalactiae subsp. dysgalactiae]UMY68509.1 CBS domain-containing protein [Streptococcus dysgalactiae subsp. equisimilis]
MSVKDYMTKEVISISPEESVAHAADLMRDKGLRRLPVIEKGQLVGLVTEGTMADASPSKATSLSIYEMNYLLNKTKIRDIMIRQVVTVEPDASLEDAIYEMMTYKVGVLPVVQNNQVVGIITDRDVFKAFLEVSGYGVEGIRVVLLADNAVGVLAKIADCLSQENLNIRRTVVANRSNGKTVIEMQLDGTTAPQWLSERLAAAGITVESVLKTLAKPDLS